MRQGDSAGVTVIITRQMMMDASPRKLHAGIQFSGFGLSRSLEMFVQAASSPLSIEKS